MNKPFYETCSRSYRTVEQLTEQEKRHVEKLVDSNEFDRVRNNGTLSSAEIVYAFRRQHLLNLGAIKRGAVGQPTIEQWMAAKNGTSHQPQLRPVTRSAAPITTPAIEPSITNDEQNEVYRRALALRIASLK